MTQHNECIMPGVYDTLLEECDHFIVSGFLALLRWNAYRVLGGLFEAACTKLKTFLLASSEMS